MKAASTTLLVFTFLTAISIPGSSQPPPIPQQGLRGLITDVRGEDIRSDPIYVNLTAEGEQAPGPSQIMHGGREYAFHLSPGNFSAKVEAAGYLSATAEVHIPPNVWVWQNFTLQVKDSPLGGRSETDLASAAKAVGIPVGIAIGAAILVALVARRRG